MNLIPSRGKTGEPGSPDAKFRYMKKYKKNQRSAQSMERRRCKRKAHRINSRTNRKILRISLCHLTPAEIKSKFKLSRRVRKSGAFKRPISLVETSTVIVDDGKLAQRGQTSTNPLNKVFFNTRQSSYIGTFNSKSLKAKWKRHELVCYCVSRSIEVLAIQEHRILFNMGMIGYSYIQLLMKRVEVE